MRTDAPADRPDPSPAPTATGIERANQRDAGPPPSAPPPWGVAPDPPRRRRSPLAELGRELLRLFVIAAIVYLGLRFSIQTVVIESGSSMEPNLHAGEYLIVSKMAYYIGQPRRGDVVVVTPSFGVPWIKRVIGLPGDMVEVRNGALYLNGQRQVEPYINEPIRYNFSPQQMPVGYYFVLGDNRNPSVDSHLTGPLPRSSFIGKAWFVYWPPWQWGGVPHYDLQPR